MIRFKKENILEELKELGYTTYKIRNDKLLSEGVLTKLRGKNANITLDTLDTLCSLLDCDIDDIIEYVPDWAVPKSAILKPNRAGVLMPVSDAELRF